MEWRGVRWGGAMAGVWCGVGCVGGGEGRGGEGGGGGVVWSGVCVGARKRRERARLSG